VDPYRANHYGCGYSVRCSVCHVRITPGPLMGFGIVGVKVCQVDGVFAFACGGRDCEVRINVNISSSK
jgi:hypothetical protein